MDNSAQIQGKDSSTSTSCTFPCLQHRAELYPHTAAELAERSMEMQLQRERVSVRGRLELKEARELKLARKQMGFFSNDHHLEQLCLLPERGLLHTAEWDFTKLCPYSLNFFESWSHLYRERNTIMTGLHNRSIALIFQQCCTWFQKHSKHHPKHSINFKKCIIKQQLQKVLESSGCSGWRTEGSRETLKHLT